MRTARPGLIAAGVACLFFSYVLRARALAGHAGAARADAVLASPSARRSSALPRRFVLPARAGEVVRPWLLARARRAAGTAAVFATIVIERMLDLVTVLALLGSIPAGLRSRPVDDGSGDVRRGARRSAAGGGGGGGRDGGDVRLRRAIRPASASWSPGAQAGCRPGRAAIVAGLPQAFGDGLAVGAQAARSWPWRSRGRCRCGCRSPPRSGWCRWRSAWSCRWPGRCWSSALLVVGVAVPTPGAVGGFHEAYRHRRHVVLRRRQRPCGRRRDRAARGRLRADAGRRGLA